MTKTQIQKKLKALFPGPAEAAAALGVTPRAVGYWLARRTEHDQDGADTFGVH